MKVVVTRDSVAAGDDALAPHEATWELPGEPGVRDVLAALDRDRYLPDVRPSTWVVLSRGGVAFAVVAQAGKRGTEPRILPGVRDEAAALAGPDGVVRLHFGYRRQADPDVVHDQLCGTPPQA
ncbi:MAG: hypothetical protein HOV66_02050 [Streptomycetaceae bacterium]|nr:hypothetical protein [Streptomycetaceae bacterium]